MAKRKAKQATGPAAFTVDGRALLDGLKAVAKVVPSKPTLPVLADVLVEASDGELVLSGTDFDNCVTVRVPAEIQQSGGVCVPAKAFKAIAEGGKDEQLRCTVVEEPRKGPSLKIERGPGVFTLLGIPAVEFPSVAAATEKVKWSETTAVPEESLRELVDWVAECASTDGSRPIINGLLVEFRRDRIQAVATNGHRLAVRSLALATPWSKLDVILAPITVDLLKPLFKNAGSLTVAVGETHIGFEANGTRLVSRLIEGPYPNYQQVIPVGQPMTMIVVRDLLAEALSRCEEVASEATHCVVLELDGQTLTLRSSHPDNGTYEERLAVEWDGPAFRIGCNARYFRHLLETMPTETVRVGMESPETAMRIDPVGELDGEYVQLLMPLRIIED